MSNISIYFDKIHVDNETGMVHLEGVDISQVVAEFNQDDVLNCIDGDVIAEYYIEANKD